MSVRWHRLSSVDEDLEDEYGPIGEPGGALSDDALSPENFSQDGPGLFGDDDTAAADVDAVRAQVRKHAEMAKNGECPMMHTPAA